MANRKQHGDIEERNRDRLLEVLANWDDDEKLEKGRELFYADR